MSDEIITTKVTVTMTVYEWHMLLSLIEASLSIVGVPEFANNKYLYRLIANQLNDNEVKTT